MYMICSKTTKSDMHKADLVLHDFHDWSNLSVVSGHEKAMANEKSMVKGERSHHWWKQSQRADGKTKLVIVFGHGCPEAENRILLETKALSNHTNRWKEEVSTDNGYHVTSKWIHGWSNKLYHVSITSF